MNKRSIWMMAAAVACGLLAAASTTAQQTRPAATPVAVDAPSLQADNKLLRATVADQQKLIAALRGDNARQARRIDELVAELSAIRKERRAAAAATSQPASRPAPASSPVAQKTADLPPIAIDEITPRTDLEKIVGRRFLVRVQVVAIQPASAEPAPYLATTVVTRDTEYGERLLIRFDDVSGRTYQVQCRFPCTESMALNLRAGRVLNLAGTIAVASGSPGKPVYLHALDHAHSGSGVVVGRPGGEPTNSARAARSGSIRG